MFALYSRETQEIKIKNFNDGMIKCIFVEYKINSFRRDKRADSSEQLDLAAGG